MGSALSTDTEFQPSNGVSASSRQVGGMIVTMAVVLFWGSSVSASCGNYLFRGGEPGNSHSTPMVSTVGVHAEGAASEREPLRIPVRRCSGPNCSGNPMPMAPVPAAPAQLIRAFDQATLLESLGDVMPTRRAIEIPESVCGARFEPASIFRPPAA